MSHAFALALSNDSSKVLVAALFKGLVVADVTNPMQPEIVQYIKTRSAAQGVSLSADQKTAYIADTQAGLTVIRFR
jgi:hypothetical protein